MQDEMENEIQNGNEDDLEEGELYVVKNGELEHIQRDPDDTMRKVRLTEDAVKELIVVQRKMRKEMQGYKPDMALVASALVSHAAKLPEAPRLVRLYLTALMAAVQ